MSVPTSAVTRKLPAKTVSKPTATTAKLHIIAVSSDQKASPASKAKYAVKIKPGPTNPTTVVAKEPPRPSDSSVIKFNRLLREKVGKGTSDPQYKTATSMSLESWRVWPAPRRTVVEPVLPRCRRAVSYDSSASSDISLNVSDGDESNTSDSSKEKFYRWLEKKTFVVRLDLELSARTWKINKLVFKRIPPEKTTVGAFKNGLEFTVGLPQDIINLRFAGEDMQDFDTLEKSVMNEGQINVGVFSIWKDFVRTLFTGNFNKIVEGIILQDQYAKSVHADDFDVVISRDEQTRKKASANEVMRQLSSNTLRENAENLERIIPDKLPRLGIYTVVKEKNLITEEMRQQMVVQRLHVAVLFAFATKHKSLLDWIFNHPAFDKDYRYASGRRPLFYAVFHQDVPHVEELLHREVDWQTPDDGGMTVLELVKRTHNKVFKKLFAELTAALHGGDAKKKKGESKSKSATRKRK
ncbi:hypothetical protein RvY_00812 [Ramazzottius varieornatus]|uniref:Ubiquitin-like domain-containing protein n=1 Tax=Ramazzottius varieornatus TaxID=947166 RepID=A0A1D1UK79_RAMVA|nr:hypothetical protein RvY_00812 [Ramazzottius varieornatus]